MLAADPGSVAQGWHRDLLDPLDEDRGPGRQLSIWAGDGFIDWTWDDWRLASWRTAGALKKAGVRQGKRVACILTNTPEACSVVPAIWMLGAAAVSLPTIAAGMSATRYLEQLRRICSQARPHVVLADASFAGHLSGADLGSPVVALQDLALSREVEPTPPQKDAEVFVQYSSGTTGSPRGCVLTAGAVIHQLSALAQTLEIDPGADVGVSWLPLSHDMGLFGCLLLSYWTGARLTLSTPPRFLGQPLSWLHDCARAQATITVAPNFAFELISRIGNRHRAPAFPMRRCIVGGERVEPGALERANAVFGDVCFPAEAFVPAYGLAEAVLAVSADSAPRAPRILTVEREALEMGEVVHATPGSAEGVRLTSVGTALPGVAVRIDGAGGAGEICVRSPSLASGYLERPGLTRRVFRDGELRTGDTGFIDDGELFVTGRLDDMLCVAGRNIFAREIEAELKTVQGIRPGRSVLVDVPRDGRATLAMVAEVNDPRSNLDRVAQRCQRIVRQTAAVHLAECHFLPRGSMPKTPSGKVQRFRCRMIAEDPPVESHTITL